MDRKTISTTKRLKPFLLLATGLAFFFSFFPPAWGQPFPFEDCNGNGLFDTGDRDVTDDITDDGIFSTPCDLVIPAEVGKLATESPGGFFLMAANMTVNADLYAKKGTSRIFLRAQEGSTAVGEGVTLKAGGLIQLSAKQDVVVGASASLAAPKRGIGSVVLYAEEGDVWVMEGSDLFARNSIRMVTEAGEVHVLPDCYLHTKGSRVTVSSAKDVVINGSKLKTENLHVHTQGHLIDFQDNYVDLPKDGGLVVLSAAGSTVNLSGTQFENLDEGSLVVVADTIIE